MIAYLDTSAILKLLLIDEEGTEVVDGLWAASDAAVTSRLAYPEGRAALAAAARSGRLSQTASRRGRRALDDLFQQLDVVELGARIAAVAGEVSDAYGLRAADAVHLASALEVAPTPGAGVVVTWDARLARAAAEARLHVAPPSA